MEITINEITSENKVEYKAFLKVGLLNDEDNFRITPLDDLNSDFPTKEKDDSFTLGAYFQNQLVGIVSFMRDGADRQKLQHKGILFRMYVSLNFRGRGIAKRLMKSVIERASAINGIEQINLTVMANNDKAKVLYEKLGFSSYGREENAIKWNGKYFDEEMIVLKLR